MKIYLQIDDQNRVIGYGDRPSSDNDVELDVAEDHEVIRNPFIYRYENGELIKDEEFQQAESQKQQDRRNAPSAESQIADLTFQLMESDSVANEAQQANADLMFLLMEKGVI